MKDIPFYIGIVVAPVGLAALLLGFLWGAIFIVSHAWHAGACP